MERINLSSALSSSLSVLILRYKYCRPSVDNWIVVCCSAVLVATSSGLQAPPSCFFWIFQALKTGPLLHHTFLAGSILFLPSLNIDTILKPSPPMNAREVPVRKMECDLPSGSTASESLCISSSHNVSSCKVLLDSFQRLCSAWFAHLPWKCLASTPATSTTKIKARATEQVPP